PGARLALSAGEGYRRQLAHLAPDPQLRRKHLCAGSHRTSAVRRHRRVQVLSKARAGGDPARRRALQRVRLPDRDELSGMAARIPHRGDSNRVRRSHRRTEQDVQANYLGGDLDGVETPLVVADRQGMTVPRGFPFIKMSGSGNDFVFFDVRSTPAHPFAEPATIRALCAHGTGVGADGVVLLEPSDSATFTMRYFNADGTLASLCGNATLCAGRLAVELGIVSAERGAAGFRFDTGVGSVQAWVTDRRRPEIELAAPQDLQETLPESVQTRR